MVEDETDTQRPSKKAKTEETISSSQIQSLVEANKNLASKIDALTSIMSNQVYGSHRAVAPNKADHHSGAGNKIPPTKRVNHIWEKLRTLFPPKDWMEV